MGFPKQKSALFQGLFLQAAVDEFEDGDGIVIPSITGDRQQFGSLTFDKNLHLGAMLGDGDVDGDGFLDS